MPTFDVPNLEDEMDEVVSTSSAETVIHDAAGARNAARQQDRVELVEMTHRAFYELFGELKRDMDTIRATRSKPTMTQEVAALREEIRAFQAAVAANTAPPPPKTRAYGQLKTYPTDTRLPETCDPTKKRKTKDWSTWDGKEETFYFWLKKIVAKLNQDGLYGLLGGERVV